MSRNNLKISKRQTRLLEELKKCDGELSGQELYRQLLQSEDAMGLATVYRNLQLLIKQGLIRSRHLPTGEVLYTHVERDVHHLTCVDCGETKPLKSCPVKGINLPQQSSKNFQLLFHTLEFFGICQKCSQKNDL